MADEAVLRIILEDSGGQRASAQSPPSAGQSTGSSQQSSQGGTSATNAGASRPHPQPSPSPPPAGQSVPASTARTSTAPPPAGSSTTAAAGATPGTISPVDQRAIDSYQTIARAVNLARTDVAAFSRAMEGVQGQLFRMRQSIDPQAIAGIFLKGGDAAAGLLKQLRDINALVGRGDVGQVERLQLTKGAVLAAASAVAATKTADAPKTDTTWIDRLVTAVGQVNRHILIEGQSGSGKSLLTRHIAFQRMDRGEEVHVVDPGHGSAEWKGAKSVFGADTAGTDAAKFLKDTLQERKQTKEEAAKTGQRMTQDDFAPMTLVFSDFKKLMQDSPELAKEFNAMLQEARKFNISIIAEAASMSGIKGVASMRPNFAQEVLLQSVNGARQAQVGGETFATPILPDYADRFDPSIIRAPRPPEPPPPPPEFDPAEGAERRREAERRRALVDEAYREKYGDDLKETQLDKLLKVANRFRGTIGGFGGALIGATLDVVSAFRQAQVDVQEKRREAQLIREARDPSRVATPAPKSTVEAAPKLVPAYASGTTDSGDAGEAVVHPGERVVDARGGIRDVGTAPVLADLPAHSVVLPKDLAEQTRSVPPDQEPAAIDAATRELNLQSPTQSVKSIRKKLPPIKEWKKVLKQLYKQIEVEGVDPGSRDALCGLCTLGSEELQEVLTSRGISTRIVTGYHAKDTTQGSHTWLETVEGTVIDPTEAQFIDTIPVGKISVHTKEEAEKLYRSEEEDRGQFTVPQYAFGTTDTGSAQRAVVDPGERILSPAQQSWTENIVFDKIDFSDPSAELLTGKDLYNLLYEDPELGSRVKVNEWLKSKGFDGITHVGQFGARAQEKVEGVDQHKVVIAFDPTQIKHVDNLDPDPSDPRYRYADGSTDIGSAKKAVVDPGERVVASQSNKRRRAPTTKLAPYTMDQLIRSSVQDLSEQTGIPLERLAKIKVDPREAIDSVIKGAGGYFDPITKEIALADDTPRNEVKDRVAHELVHALDLLMGGGNEWSSQQASTPARSLALAEKERLLESIEYYDWTQNYKNYRRSGPELVAWSTQRYLTETSPLDTDNPPYNEDLWHEVEKEVQSFLESGKELTNDPSVNLPLKRLDLYPRRKTLIRHSKPLPLPEPESATIDMRGGTRDVGPAPVVADLPSHAIVLPEDLAEGTRRVSPSEEPAAIAAATAELAKRKGQQSHRQFATGSVDTGAAGPASLHPGERVIPTDPGTAAVATASRGAPTPVTIEGVAAGVVFSVKGEVPTDVEATGGSGTKGTAKSTDDLIDRSVEAYNKPGTTITKALMRMFRPGKKPAIPEVPAEPTDETGLPPVVSVGADTGAAATAEASTTAGVVSTTGTATGTAAAEAAGGLSGLAGAATVAVPVVIALGKAAMMTAQMMSATADHLAAYNGQIAGAVAAAEVRQIHGDIRRAQEAAPVLSSFVDSTNQLQQSTENLKIEFIKMVGPLITGIADAASLAVSLLTSILQTGNAALEFLGNLPGISHLLDLLTAFWNWLKSWRNFGFGEISNPDDDPVRNIMDGLFTGPEI